jgi:hypothetical protein
MPEPKLLDKVRTKLRSKHYSKKTEEVYTNWIKRYIFFHSKKHTKDMGADEIKAFIKGV